MQFQLFVVPISNAEQAVAELNLFLRSHKIITVSKELVTTAENSFYSILVEYLQAPVSTAAAEKSKAPIDYKEILASDDFALFSYLREQRQKIAEQQAVPVYVVVTNAQLADIAVKKPTNITELAKIEGIGQSKCEKYGEALLAALQSYNTDSNNSEKSQ